MTTLADVVQLVRHALNPETEVLEPFADIIQDRFESWLNSQRENGLIFDDEQLRWLKDIAEHISGSLEIQIDDFDYLRFHKKVV